MLTHYWPCGYLLFAPFGLLRIVWVGKQLVKRRQWPPSCLLSYRGVVVVVTELEIYHQALLEPKLLPSLMCPLFVFLLLWEFSVLLNGDRSYTRL